MATYGLMADYALGTAMDSVEEAQGEVEAAMDEAGETIAKAAAANPDRGRTD